MLERHQRDGSNAAGNLLIKSHKSDKPWENVQTVRCVDGKIRKYLWNTWDLAEAAGKIFLNKLLSV